MNDKDLIAEYRINISMAHSKWLMMGIDRLLADTGIRLENLDGIAVSIGPGSFTGLRIGLGTAKGIAVAIGKPIIPVPTLDAMASRVQFPRCQICPMVDARKKEVYAAIFEHSETSGVRRITGYMVDKPVKILENIYGETIFLGDGAEVYHDLISERLGKRALFAPKSLSPSAVTIAELGSNMFKSGIKYEEVLTPLYIRRSEAELKS